VVGSPSLRDEFEASVEKPRRDDLKDCIAPRGPPSTIVPADERFSYAADRPHRVYRRQKYTKVLLAWAVYNIGLRRTRHRSFLSGKSFVYIVYTSDS